MLAVSPTCPQHKSSAYLSTTFQTPTYNTFWDMNECLVQTEWPTESDAYEPIVQYAQVGSIKTSLKGGKGSFEAM